MKDDGFGQVSSSGIGERLPDLRYILKTQPARFEWRGRKESTMTLRSWGGLWERVWAGGIRDFFFIQFGSTSLLDIQVGMSRFCCLWKWYRQEKET